MTRRKNDFFDDLAARIFATVGDPSLTGPRKATAMEFVKISLKLAHNQGVRDGIDEAKKVTTAVFRGQEKREAAE